MARFIEELTLKVKAHYISKGRAEGHAEARAWIARRNEAIAQGKPFDEPFPGDDEPFPEQEEPHGTGRI